MFAFYKLHLLELFLFEIELRAYEKKGFWNYLVDLIRIFATDDANKSREKRTNKIEKKHVPIKVSNRD